MAENVLLYAFCKRKKRRKTDSLAQFQAYLAEDYPEYLPLPGRVDGDNNGRVALTVEESVHFSLSRDDGESIWRASTPTGGGYVHLGAEMRLYSVAMFHQLHCIERLREALVGEGDGHHTQHCLNYLRQFILCQPDLTLEEGNFMERNFEMEEDGHGDVRMPVGRTHMCSDWSVVYDAMEGNWDEWVATAQATTVV